MKKPDGQDRPVGYIAEGSHGVWPTAGSNVYEDVRNHLWLLPRIYLLLLIPFNQILVYQLTDETADGGKTWEAKDNVLPITYVPGGPYTGRI